MLGKSKEYHAVLDLLDRGQFDAAASRFYDWMAVGAISRFEFRLLLNAFKRRDVELRTV